MHNELHDPGNGWYRQPPMHTIIELITTIPLELNQFRLDAALAKCFPDYSRTQIQHWIKQGDVTVNGKVINKIRYAVSADEEIAIKSEIETINGWQAQDIGLNIVFEDEHMLIINKPAGLVAHPGAGNPDKTLVNGLLHYDAALDQLPRAGLIHRLDKDTTGLLVIGKTIKAYTILARMMEARAIAREYRAIVQGGIISGGTINEPIGRHPISRTKMDVVQSGRPAVTHYRVLKKFEKHTYLSVKLETGRTHQIRVHMAHIRHPIVGDSTYGGTRLPPAFPRQALHAYSLSLEHPINKECVSFEAPVPEDMLQLLSSL